MSGGGDKRWVTNSRDRSVAELWKALGMGDATGDRLQQLEAKLVTLTADIKAIKTRLGIP